MRRSYLSGGSLLAIAALSLMAQPANAQGAASGGTVANLEEVVVVARRTEERLQDVPISVTAISQESLQQANVASSTDLIKLVPTLSVQQGATGPGTNYSLRGIRSGVITYFNEVATASVGVDDQIWDLSSVQALAGPQGTLFGRNSTGGAVLFVPQRPTQQAEGYLQGRFGNYSLREALAVVNLPLSDILAVRLGGRMIRRDGVVDNWKTGEHHQSLAREAARLSVLFEPINTISNYTMVDYSHRDEEPYALIASGWTRSAGCLAPAPAPCLPGYTRGQIPALGDAQEARGIRSTSSILPAYTYGHTWGVSNIFSWALRDNLTFRYIAGYRYRESEEGSDKANFELPIEYGINQIFGVDDWSHELQLQGDLFERVNWTLGYFRAETESFTGTEYSLFLPPGTTPTFEQSTSNRIRSETESEAIYAQATFAVTAALNLTAGVRYTEDTATQRNSRRAPQFTFAGPNVCALPRNATGVDLSTCVRTISGKWSATTYNLSADYRFSDDLMIYVTTRRGYNGGGFNASVPDTATPGAPLPTYDPEYITDYEAGIKADWSLWGRPIRTNLSAFLAKYTDIQRNQRGFSVTGAIYNGIANGPKATIKGAQLESAFRPFDDLTLTANYGYLHTRYDRGTVGFPEGNRFAQAPEHTLNLGAHYQRPLVQGGSLVGSLNYTYQSEITFQDDQSTSSTAFQKGYAIVDARVGWEEVGGRPFDVVFFVKNLTDEAYAIERQDQTGLFGFTGTVYNDPRTYGLELTYRFGD